MILSMILAYSAIEKSRFILNLKKLYTYQPIYKFFNMAWRRFTYVPVHKWYGPGPVIARVRRFDFEV